MEETTQPAVEELKLLKRGQVKTLIDLTKLTGPPFDRTLIRNNHLYLAGRYVIVELDLQELNLTDDLVNPPAFTPGSIHMDELKKWYSLEHGWLTIGDLQTFPREDATDQGIGATLESINQALTMNLEFTAQSVEDFTVAAWQLKLILRLLPNAATLLTTFKGGQSTLYRVAYGPWTIVGAGIRTTKDEKEKKDDGKS